MNPNDPLFEKPEKLGLYNPLKDDFTVNYDQKPYTIPAQEIKYFPYPLGLYIRQNLKDAVMNARELNPIIEKNTEDILDEITV